MRKVLIASPTNKITGGTELLQQLCATLRASEIDASMWYASGEVNRDFRNHFDAIYHNPSSVFTDDTNIIIVIPETMAYLLETVKKAEPVMWWLSVDNYIGRNSKLRNPFRLYCRRLAAILKYNPKIRRIDNLVQSRYAYEYLSNAMKVDPKSIFYLSDYLNGTYIAKVSLLRNKRQNRILYNPAKTSPFLERLMKDVTEYEWCALKGFSIDQMQNVMSGSKLYVDFGPHPGKDRIPREAAICGCCVITGRRGSAKNDVDVPIPSKYKFDETTASVDEVHNCITKIMNNYEIIIKDFENYREIITCEEERFTSDALNYFSQKVNAL